MSDDVSRRHRPPLARTGPLRNWSTLFAPPGGRRQPAAALGTPPTGSPEREDVVSRSVDLGYRLIEEYIEQGQRTAQQFGAAGFDPQRLTSDVQDLAARLAQYASEFTAVWVELLQMTLTGLAGAAGAPAARGPAPAWWSEETGLGPERAPSSSAPATAADAPPCLRLALEAAQRASVEIDVQPSRLGHPLVVHALRTPDDSAPRIDQVQFQPATDEAGATVRIAVPAGQPAGVYSGLVIDTSTNRPAGSVTVVVHAASGASAE